MKAGTSQEWLLMVHQLPQKPTKLRVRTWRKLQAFGAIPIKNSVYVLPFNEKTNEDFGWLKQEIESAGGEAALFRADSVEGATDKEIINLFRAARDEDYAGLITELEGASGAISQQRRTGSLSVNKLAEYESAVARFRQELERLLSIDFFNASNRKKARAAFDKCLKELQSAKGKESSAADDSARLTKLNSAEYQNRRWVTRRSPHIDRLASGWLISRFIDKKPRFHFVAEGEKLEGAVHFDMIEAEFTHVGDDCTFETLIKSFCLNNDQSLRQIAEIVHDIDLKDKKFNRLEAFGLDATVRGLARVIKDDRSLLNHCIIIFDGLYEQFRFRNEEVVAEKTVEKSSKGKKNNERTQ